MKVCILTPRFPFPENGGDVLRINSIARYLKSKNYELILVSFYESNISMKEEYFTLYDKIYKVKRSKLNSLFMSIFFIILGKPIQCGYYYSKHYLHLLQKVIKLEKPDLYISHLLRMVPYLEKLQLNHNSIIEMTDALSKTYKLSTKAKGSLLKKIIYKFEYILICRYEKYVVSKFNEVVLVSNTDVEYLKHQCGMNYKNLFMYTNGVECLSEPKLEYKKNRICFIGNMRTLQNQDAVLYFIQEIFPIIKKSIPDAVFTVIGAQPPEKITALADNENIIVTGFVDDIQPLVSDCCLNVAPVRVAAGIQNKVLVAMGCGVPVVMSSLIASAIPELSDGINCFISDNDKTFAEKCIMLMKNEEIRSLIANNGYKTVKNHYSWNKKLDGYENM